MINQSVEEILFVYINGYFKNHLPGINKSWKSYEKVGNDI